ncbi:zinc phosphodiesterase ELAC protein 2-like isoform X3 [Xenia sp. Carnegie-2017]|uniref:zinc phosphodiesterase ELAC protein 2-like isoform X3 n=1 Tax=Xenia sp. Carnegie-2017 TaxID=2897299 RepID=UPI001F050401|nr:zinc phosphodiesterase ELAC protein 2-like isoform X3 [Xenia sp. Carnegie-2017]XP_046855041.1 zinc phosphodiesterase ELAC protein 2-like isoform X3 [Xenia sp. Carnegie-2017]
MATGCPARYIINAGENTLRNFRMGGLPSKGLDKMFMTGSTINHIGGLTNMLLATQNDNFSVDKLVDVYGPPNLDAFLQTIQKSFQYMSKFEFVKPHQIEERIKWLEIASDDNFQIFAFATSDGSQENGRTIFPNLAVSYAFLLQEPLRRVRMDVAENLGLGQDVLSNVIEKCQMGYSVDLPCGTQINPDDILHPTPRRQSFVVIDCPSKQVLNKLSSFMSRDFFSSDLHTHVDIVIHMTGKDIANSMEYKSWMTTFDPETKHLMMNEHVIERPAFTVFDEVYDRLNKLHVNIFPPLYYSLFMDKIHSGFKDFPEGSVHFAAPTLRYNFRPIAFEGFEQNLMAVKAVNEKESSANGSRSNVFASSTLSNDFQVVFLGTGSRISSNLRNTSGVLLNLSDETSILMDCGEGTLRQMFYHYGDDVNTMLKRIRTVFVSHMHIDHHLGLVNILRHRKKIMGGSSFVRIIGPETLDLYLRYFEMMCGETFNFRFTQFWWVKRGLGKKEGKQFSRSLGFSSISVVPTKHSDYSHGLVLERSGWKIVYSADTRPCKQLIDAGENATLLIHEATFDDKLLYRAKETAHCTVSEAIKCSELMKAEYTILTHISNRHIFPCKSSRLPHHVSFAFDHMTVEQKDLRNIRGIMANVERTVVYQWKKKRRQKQAVKSGEGRGV